MFSKRRSHEYEKNKRLKGAIESTFEKPFRRNDCRENGVEIRLPRGSLSLETRTPLFVPTLRTESPSLYVEPKFVLVIRTEATDPLGNFVEVERTRLTAHVTTSPTFAVFPESRIR